MAQTLDVAQGLEYLHTLKPHIIHGDLKGVRFLYWEDQKAYSCYRSTFLSHHPTGHVWQILVSLQQESLKSSNNPQVQMHMQQEP